MLKWLSNIIDMVAWSSVNCDCYFSYNYMHNFGVCVRGDTNDDFDLPFPLQDQISVEAFVGTFIR